MPKLRVHNFAISLDGGGERFFDHLDGGPEGYECVEFVSSGSVAHVRLARASQVGAS